MALDKPPAITDKFFLIRFNNGNTQLVKARNKKEFCRQFGGLTNQINSVDKVSYADLTNSITQRVYDYQFAFENFIQTSTSDTAAYQQALANLGDVFSNDLTLYVINGPNGQPLFPALNNKAAVVGFQETLHGIFQGFTLHTAPNVRVRPICNSTTSQASSGSAEVDYSLINKGAGAQDYLDTGYYNFTWKYEADNVWRIVTWSILNKLDTLIPPATVTPVPFVPYPNNPPTNC